MEGREGSDVSGEEERRFFQDAFNDGVGIKFRRWIGGGEAVS